jgi:hypothetical protein
MRREDTMLAARSAGMTEYEQQLVTQIGQYGWRSTHVYKSDNSPCLTYTTGFCLSLASPEILVFDFPPNLAHDVFGQIYRELRAGRIFSEAAPEGKIVSGETVYFFPVAENAAVTHLISSKWFYRDRPFPCRQLVWADQAGLFPWEPGFDARLADLQPDLSPTGWKNLIRR